MKSILSNNIFLSGAGLSILLVSSCASLQEYKTPDAPSAALYRDQSSIDSLNLAQTPWRKLFTDAALRELIETALRNNYDLKIAVTRIESASADLEQSKRAFFPTASATAQVNRNKSSSAQMQANGVNITNIPTNTFYTLTGTASWEADIWGKLKSSKKAALARYLQSESYRRAVQTQLVADIATGYYQLLAYDEQIRIIEATVENRREDVEIVKALKKSAITTGADVVNSEANLKAVQLQLPDLKQARRAQENALSLLMGLPPTAIARGSFDAQQLDTSLHVGIPAQLLANRPDVQQAEYAFRNAFDLTNVARTYFYPSLTISGTAGWATANTLSGFFNGTFYGNILGGLTQPIFNQGLNKQRLKVAQATQQEAYYTFQNTLLQAGQEVSDALYAYDAALEKENLRKSQLLDYQKVVDFTKELLKYTSSTNYTDVLSAEQNLLSAKLNTISDRMQQLQAIVALYRSLGGGWQNGD